MNLESVHGSVYYYVLHQRRVVYIIFSYDIVYEWFKCHFHVLVFVLFCYILERDFFQS